MRFNVGHNDTRERLNRRGARPLKRVSKAGYENFSDMKCTSGVGGDEKSEQIG